VKSLIAGLAIAAMVSVTAAAQLPRAQIVPTHIPDVDRHVEAAKVVPGSVLSSVQRSLLAISLN
jgi:hypothetical protein